MLVICMLFHRILNADGALKELLTHAGTQFCPVAVEAFVSEFRKRKKKLPEETKEAAKEEARREAEKLASKEAERAAKEAAKREVKEAKRAQEAVHDISSEIYEGDVRLVIPSPAGFEQVTQFKERLEKVKKLRIVWVGGSVEEGAIIVASLQNPMTLIRILNEMPTVEKVDKKNGNIVVMLTLPYCQLGI